MKILSLRFKNLNSLAGEWFIDFTAPEYVSDGIFAITGPTGSGKTTILDAISLALYGQTPRLEKVNMSGNEVMSRHTGECFAEVVFEAGSGRYRCHWSQHRARRNPQGLLQAQKHEISDETTGKIIESKLQDTLAAVVECTGMDFLQFTRSMLLAQGGFAAFLQAPPDERSPVLEQITGTEIYSAISIKVHERNRLEQLKLDALREECSGIRLLGEDELAEAVFALKDREEQEDGIAGLKSKSEEALRWLRQITVMKAGLAGMEEEFRELRSREERFYPDRQRLEKAMQASRFEPAYTAVMQLRQLQDRDLLDKTVAERELERSKAVFEERAGEFRVAEKRLLLLKEEETALAGVIRVVRALDLQISAGEERRFQSESALNVLQKRIAASEGQLAEAERELLSERKKMEDAERYLSEHEADGGLATSLSGIEEKVRQCQATETAELDARKVRNDASKRLEKAAIALRELMPATAGARKDFDSCLDLQTELAGQLEGLLEGSSLSELRSETARIQERIRALEILQARLMQLAGFEERILTVRQALRSAEAELKHNSFELDRISLLQRKEEQIVEGLQREAELHGKIRSLEDERRMLQEGLPCPLCGSIHHPFVGEDLPDADMAADALRQGRLSLHERALEITGLRVAAARLETEIRQLHGQRDELRKSIETDLQWCRHSAGTLSIEGEPSVENIDAILDKHRLLSVKLSDRLAAAERIEGAHTAAAQEEKNFQQRLTEALRQQESAGYALKTAETEAARAGESEALAGEKRKTADAVLNLELADYAIAAGDGLSYPDVLRQLHSRLERRQEVELRKDAARQRITVLEGFRSVQQELLKTNREDCLQKETAYAAEGAALAGLQRQREGLFGSKNPDAEEGRAAEVARLAEEVLEEVRSAREVASRRIVTLSERVAMLGASSAERSVMISERQALLEHELSGGGFESLERFLSARLDRHEFERLEKQAGALAARRLELETLKGERLGKLLQEEERALTDSSEEVLCEELERFSASLGTLRSDIAALKIRLQEHERSALLLREKTSALAAQQIECARWSSLNELIGSSDGKKFRNFAQGLTFEIMIGHANRQLAGMTDRYLLVRSAAHPLALDVIDTWQAGEVRSTKNLSGGESFIVSLALALGLSHMSSRNVRVDSLFLDEGFGTLDEESLDTALKTLSGLHQNGKIIGIISHVPALKERIAARIRVHPVSGGRSRLSGPGVIEGNG